MIVDESMILDVSNYKQEQGQGMPKGGVITFHSKGAGAIPPAGLNLYQFPTKIMHMPSIF